MERSAVKKGTIFVGFTLIVASAIELIFILIIGLTEATINGQAVSLSSLILGGGIIPIEGAFLWIFLTIIMCFFAILGFGMFKIVTKKDIDSMTIGKYLSILGMLILVLSFVKLEFIILMQKTAVNYDTNAVCHPSVEICKDTFQSLLYNPDITPFITASLWIFFTAVVCGYLIIGLIVSASGLKWVLELEKAEAEDKPAQ